MPGRIQLSRAKGWRKPAGAIVVSRPSKWGNPYGITGCRRIECHPAENGWCAYDPSGLTHLGSFTSKPEAAKLAVDLYDGWIRAKTELWNALPELAGHDLCCWCPLLDDEGKRFPCHADILVRLSNGAML